ncbi:MAG: alpha/beta hydrolase [Burkholderiaceae bacterium]|nr:alpha/beta hydrolase [Microbacteriaceae bacterium]
MTETVTRVESADGTTIAVEWAGSGPPLVLVGGAFNTRQSAVPLARRLESDFTVWRYDRRGRGESGAASAILGERDNGRAVGQDVADLAAVVALAAEGGSPVGVYGHSSGAIVALEGAARGLPIARVAAYEPPYTSGMTEEDRSGATGDAIRAAVTAGDPDTAARVFMRLVGIPPQAIDGIANAPFWSGMVAIAHTLPYDLALSGDGAAPDRLSRIAVPTLVLDGGASPEWAGEASSALLGIVPAATRITVPGQDHNVDETVLAPVLREFFQAR